MDLSEFLRAYPLRSPNIMWFLGAGASAASKIPTAYHMTWEFKRALFCSANRVPVSSCGDLSDEFVRNRIQSYCNSLADAPEKNSDAEYSYYFAKAYPNEEDRRQYIDKLVANGEPSFGHLALSALVRINAVQMLWTTNFDRMVEDSIVRLCGTSSKLNVATLGSHVSARLAMAEARFPLYTKLHGDFQSVKLKNTKSELQAQDEELRECLTDSVRSRGLAVVGYSGRDKSIMDALRAGLDGGRGYPKGLFWFTRDGVNVLDSVKELIDDAKAVGVDAHIIESETFDELLGDVLAQIPNLPSETQQLFDERPKRITNVPLATTRGSWPILRTNAFPIVNSPSVCRKIVCDIGGYSKIRDAVKLSNADIVFGRRNVGVLAFGADEQVRNAFDQHNIREFSLHSIEPHRLRYDSAEHGLLFDALMRAISRERPINVERRRRKRFVIVDPEKASDPDYIELNTAVKQISGRVGKTSIGWKEAARIHMEYRMDGLWILVEPSIFLDDFEHDNAGNQAKDFVRERLARRYNTQWNQVLDAWATLLFGKEREIELRAFGCGSGVDATFCVNRTSGYSWKGGAR